MPADYTDEWSNYSGVPVTVFLLQGTELFGCSKPLQIVVPAGKTNLRTLFLAGRNPPVTGRPVYVNYQRNPAAMKP